ncbi:MAG: hypothetical protein WBQ34_13130 [Candidatus Acidiferrales bacterium]
MAAARWPAVEASCRVEAERHRDRRLDEAPSFQIVEQMLKAPLPPAAAVPELSDAWNALAPELPLA